MESLTKTIATFEEEASQRSANAMANSVQSRSNSPKKLTDAARAEAVDAFVRYKTGTSGTPTVEKAVASVASLSINSTKPAIAAPFKLDSFPLFPTLPIELRFKVWRRALPLFPRIVRIGGPCASGTPKFHVKDRSTTLEFVVVKCTNITALLGVNKEARGELLKHYITPFVGNHLGNFSRSADYCELSTRHLRVNFDIDTIFIIDFGGMSRLTPHPFTHLFQTLFGAEEESVRKGIKLLAASEDVWGNLQFMEKVLNEPQPTGPGNIFSRQLHPPYKVLHEFGQLKQIFVVTKKLQERYTPVGFKDVDVGSREGQDYKERLEKRLKEMEGREECAVKVVALDQKYLGHKALLAAALLAKAQASSSVKGRN